MTTTLHPADQAAADRFARAVARLGICIHDRRPGECRTCLELRHAEQNSVTVRAAYAIGDWPPFRSFGLGGLSRRLAAGHPRHAS